MFQINCYTGQIIKRFINFCKLTKWIQVVRMILSLISNNLNKFFLIAFLVFAGIISANTQIVKVEVEGMGESLQSAIDRGLTEAMGRVNGRSINLRY